MRYSEIAEGLRILLADSKIHAEIPIQKLHAMQDIYFQTNPRLFTREDCDKMEDSLKAATYKFYLSNLNLEQLWSLSHNKRDYLFYALENTIDQLSVTDDELLLISFSLEGFLFQARAFLDFYMLYLCLSLKADHPGYMSTKKFFKALEGVQQSPFAEKASQIHIYFYEHVFGSTDWDGLNPNNWGSLLRSLRDKVAHKNRLRPSYESDEVLVGGIRFDWPTLQGITYDRFCQYIQNGMFSLLTDLAPILYELEWKAGPYNQDMWK